MCCKKSEVEQLHSPKVSIFLPTVARFQQGFLDRAVNSALAQTWPDFELLVVDDGSLDGTSDYIERRVAEDSRVKHIRLPKNTGLPAYALAQAYPHATGEYFAWLFDDCELEPSHLETLLETFTANPNLGMAYGRARAQLTGDHSFIIGEPINLQAMEQGANSIPNVCVLVPRTSIERVGWYDPHVLLKRLCDWDLWLRIAREFDIGFIDRILATEHGVGLPGSLGRMHHANDELSVRYAHTERNARLAPERLEIADAFRSDLGFELDAEDEEKLILSFFEHAVLTMDFQGSLDHAISLHGLGLLHHQLARFALQQPLRDIGANEILFSAMVGLVRRRLESHASSQIKSEVGTRDALLAADQRAESLLLIQQQMEVAKASDDEREARIASLVDNVTLLEGTLVAVRSEMTEKQRFQEQLVRDLNEAHHSLFIYRDAADRRMEMLHAADERAAAATVLAEVRLSLIEQMQTVAVEQQAVVDGPEKQRIGRGKPPQEIV